MSAASEQPPLELNRPQTDAEVPPEWGSPDYQGTSLSVGDMGAHPLDIVASYLPDTEFRTLMAAEPAFRNAQLVSDVVDSQVRLDISELDQRAAFARINRARPQVFGAQGQDCTRGLPVTVLALFGAGGGGALAWAGATSDEVTFTAVGGAVMGVSSLWLLGAGLDRIRNAYQRRCAYHVVMAAHHSLTMAQHEENLVRETLLPSRLAQLRAIDMQGIEPNQARAELESKGEMPPGPR